MKIRALFAVGLLLTTFTRAASGASAGPKLPLEAHNAGVGLTVSGMKFQPVYGEETAPDGKQFLVLSATWKNRVDEKLATERELPLAFKNDNLAESLQVLIDGRDLVAVETRATDTAHLDANDADAVGSAEGSTRAAYIRSVTGLKNGNGKRSLVYYALAKPGDTVAGDLIFVVPLTPARSLELLYQDPFGGAFRLPLFGESAAATVPKDLQANEIFDLAAHLVPTPTELGQPPPDRRWVVIDFQGRSRMKVLDDLPAYDSSHEKGVQGWRADAAHWMEFRDNLEIIADGTIPCGMETQSEVNESGMFSPVMFSGQRLVFLVPAKSTSLDLRCFFPIYTIPGIDGPVLPKPMTFHLAGPASANPGPPPKVEKKVRDGDLEISFGHSLAAQFAGETAAPDEVFVVLDCTLRDLGKEHGEFRASEQLVRFQGEEQVGPDELSPRGPLAPPRIFYIFPGETRHVQLVWRMPKKATAVQFGLKGNEVAEKFSLPLGKL